MLKEGGENLYTFRYWNRASGYIKESSFRADTLFEAGCKLYLTCRWATFARIIETKEGHFAL